VTIDPFETLGIEPRFDLDLRAVEQRHRELSGALHPDRYAGRPAAERRLALGRAIDVNEAFRAVRDPVRRAEALLGRAGVAVGETSEAKPPPSLLMEMMEAREELAEARRAKDLARAGKLGEAMRARQRAVEERLGRALDAGKGDPQILDGARAALGELRYVRRFLDEVDAIEEELAP
jgi:molecular chaperone HscB